jgi:hypothetical protein
MAVVTPLNNPGGPEGDTVTVDEQLLNTEYCHDGWQEEEVALTVIMVVVVQTDDDKWILLVYV